MACASAPQAREAIVHLRRAGSASRGPLNADVRRRLATQRETFV